MAFEPHSLQVGKYLSSSNSSRKLMSFMSFDDGTVGLAIVAAMLVGDDQPPPPPLARVPSTSILMSTSGAVGETKRPLPRGVPSSSLNSLPEEEEEEEEEEDSSDDDDHAGMEIDDKDESYTLVTSYVGGEAVSRRVYFEDGTGCIQTKEHFIPSLKSKEEEAAAVVFSIADPSSSSPPFQPPPGFGFLNACSLCSTKLDGKDIFLFRENAFCSKECRYQSVLDDKNLDEGTLEVLKPSDRDKSLCSDPMASAGIALQLNIASHNNCLSDI